MANYSSFIYYWYFFFFLGSFETEISIPEGKQEDGGDSEGEVEVDGGRFSLEVEQARVSIVGVGLRHDPQLHKNHLESVEATKYEGYAKYNGYTL